MMDVPGSGRGRAPHRSPHTARRVLIPRTTESRGTSAPAAASTELSLSCTRSSGRRSSVDLACRPTLGPLVLTAPHTTPTTCAGQPPLCLLGRTPSSQHRFQERATGRPEGVASMREGTEAEETPPVPTQGLDTGAGPMALSAATWWGPGGAQLSTGWTQVSEQDWTGSRPDAQGADQ